MWARIICPALASICGMGSSFRNGSKGGGISLRRVAMLWRTAHATIMSPARSGQTLNLRRHWNLDFNIPNVCSTLTRVLVQGTGWWASGGMDILGLLGDTHRIALRSNTNFEISCTSTTIMRSIFHKMQRTLLKFSVQIRFAIHRGPNQAILPPRW